jgi:hypothetical protein
LHLRPPERVCLPLLQAGNRLSHPNLAPESLPARHSRLLAPWNSLDHFQFLGTSSRCARDGTEKKSPVSAFSLCVLYAQSLLIPNHYRN